MKRKRKNKNMITIDLSVVLVALIGCGIVFALFLFFTDRDIEYTESDEVIADLAQECENGAWVKFPPDPTQDGNEQQNATFTGVLVDAQMEDDEMSDESHDTLFVTHPDYSLVFYDARNVNIEGKYMDAEHKKIYVNKIKCVGQEAREDIKVMRQNIMQYIAQQKQQIFALSGENVQEIEIEDISFVRDNIVYVYFSQDAEDGMEVLMLLEVDANADNEYKVQKLATYKYNNGGFSLSDGKDNYVKSRKTTYEYDDDVQRWVLSW